MTSGTDDVLLVRRANVEEPAGDGVDVYVVVEAGARVEAPPLARCCVVRIDAHRAELAVSADSTVNSVFMAFPFWGALPVEDRCTEGRRARLAPLGATRR